MRTWRRRGGKGVRGGCGGTVVGSVPLRVRSGHNPPQYIESLLDGGEAGGYDAVYVDLVFSIEVEVVA